VTDLVLPELVIDVTPTFVIASAIATRDFQDVHHDRDRAVERGSKDIFINILTTTGLVQRYVTDWAGPQALVRKVAIRLGVPCYAGDTLTFSGQAAAAGAAGAPGGRRRRGRGGRGGAVQPRRPRHRHRSPAAAARRWGARFVDVPKGPFYAAQRFIHTVGWWNGRGRRGSCG